MRLKILSASKPDIEMLLGRKDIGGLIKALGHSDFATQWQAAEALGKLGTEAIDQLLAALHHRNREIRLGIIEALGEIGGPKAVPALIDLLQDESVEIRWATAIALGEIRDKNAIKPLITVLGDSDKYVRYGAAIALEKLDWQPETEIEKAYLHLGKQDWEQLGRMGDVAIKPLKKAMMDRHVDVRQKVMEVIGEIESEKGISMVIQGLRDENPGVRWKAALAGPKCGIPHMFLPRGLNKRPRRQKNPRVAAFLNFILPGLGYDYLGLWFGIVIFQLDVTITLFLLSYEGEQLTYNLLLPLYALFALHAWYMARKLPEL